MAIEAAGKKAGVAVRIVATPGTLKANCGFSLRYAIEQEDAFRRLLMNCEAFHTILYHASRDGLAVKYEKVGETND